MTKYHSSWRDVFLAHMAPADAQVLIAALRAAGYMVVRDDAIRSAQTAAAANDNKARPLPVAGVFG